MTQATDMERLYAAVHAQIQYLNYHCDNTEDAARDVVADVIKVLRTPSEAAAQAGGAAAIREFSDLKPAAMCGLAAIRGILDHIDPPKETVT